MDNESEKAADDFDSKEDRKQQAALLHRLLLFERGLFAALSSLDATPALKQQHEEFNGAIMKERLEQFKSKHERALNIARRQLQMRARLIAELLRVRRAQIRDRFGFRSRLFNEGPVFCSRVASPFGSTRTATFVGQLLVTISSSGIVVIWECAQPSLADVQRASAPELWTASQVDPSDQPNVSKTNHPREAVVLADFEVALPSSPVAIACIIPTPAPVASSDNESNGNSSESAANGSNGEQDHLKCVRILAVDAEGAAHLIEIVLNTKFPLMTATSSSSPNPIDQHFARPDSAASGSNVGRASFLGAPSRLIHSTRILCTMHAAVQTTTATQPAAVPAGGRRGAPAQPTNAVVSSKDAAEATAARLATECRIVHHAGLRAVILSHRYAVIAIRLPLLGHQPSPLPHPTLLNRHSGVGVRPNAAALAAAAAAAAQTQARIRMYALFELDVIGTAPNLSLISIAARRAEEAIQEANETIAAQKMSNSALPPLRRGVTVSAQQQQQRAAQIAEAEAALAKAEATLLSHRLNADSMHMITALEVCDASTRIDIIADQPISKSAKTVPAMLKTVCFVGTRSGLLLRLDISMPTRQIAPVRAPAAATSPVGVSSSPNNASPEPDSIPTRAALSAPISLVRTPSTSGPRAPSSASSGGRSARFGAVTPPSRSGARNESPTTGRRSTTPSADDGAGVRPGSVNSILSESVGDISLLEDVDDEEVEDGDEDEAFDDLVATCTATVMQQLQGVSVPKQSDRVAADMFSAVESAPPAQLTAQGSLNTPGSKSIYKAQPPPLGLFHQMSSSSVADSTAGSRSVAAVNAASMARADDAFNEAFTSCVRILLEHSSVAAGLVHASANSLVAYLKAFQSTVRSESAHSKARLQDGSGSTDIDQPTNEPASNAFGISASAPRFPGRRRESILNMATPRARSRFQPVIPSDLPENSQIPIIRSNSAEKIPIIRSNSAESLIPNGPQHPQLLDPMSVTALQRPCDAQRAAVSMLGACNGLFPTPLPPSLTMFSTSNLGFSRVIAGQQVQLSETSFGNASGTSASGLGTAVLDPTVSALAQLPAGSFTELLLRVCVHHVACDVVNQELRHAYVTQRGSSGLVDGQFQINAPPPLLQSPSSNIAQFATPPFSRNPSTQSSSVLSRTPSVQQLQSNQISPAFQRSNSALSILALSRAASSQSLLGSAATQPTDNSLPQLSRNPSTQSMTGALGSLLTRTASTQSMQRAINSASAAADTHVTSMLARQVSIFDNEPVSATTEKPSIETTGLVPLPGLLSNEYVVGVGGEGEQPVPGQPSIGPWTSAPQIAICDELMSMFLRGIARNEDFVVDDESPASIVRLQVTTAKNEAGSSTPSEPIIVAGCADGSSWIVDTNNGVNSCLVDAAHETVFRDRFDSLQALQLLPSGRIALTFDNVGRLRIWDVPGRRLVGVANAANLNAIDASSTTMVFDSQAHRLALFDQHGWSMWRLSDQMSSPPVTVLPMPSVTTFLYHVDSALTAPPPPNEPMPREEYVLGLGAEAKPKKHTSSRKVSKAQPVDRSSPNLDSRRNHAHKDLDGEELAKAVRQQLDQLAESGAAADDDDEADERETKPHRPDMHNRSSSDSSTEDDDSHQSSFESSDADHDQHSTASRSDRLSERTMSASPSPPRTSTHSRSHSPESHGSFGSTVTTASNVLAPSAAASRRGSLRLSENESRLGRHRKDRRVSFAGSNDVAPLSQPSGPTALPESAFEFAPGYAATSHSRLDELDALVHQLLSAGESDLGDLETTLKNLRFIDMLAPRRGDHGARHEDSDREEENDKFDDTVMPPSRVTGAFSGASLPALKPKHKSKKKL